MHQNFDVKDQNFNLKPKKHQNFHLEQTKKLNFHLKQMNHKNCQLKIQQINPRDKIKKKLKNFQIR